MDGWKGFTLFGLEVHEKTGDDAEYQKWEQYHGNCFMQAHIRIKQVAVDHKETCSTAAEHGDKSNGAGNCMALAEKPGCFAEMQVLGALESQVGSVKCQQDDTKLNPFQPGRGKPIPIGASSFCPVPKRNG